VYYVAADGTSLQELFYASGEGWQPGALNNAGVKVAPGSKVLYVVGGDSGPTNPRVGYVAAGTNVLSEAWWNGQWHINNAF
jgi:hypothetical protein